jgi:hypothetical protein
LTQPPGGHAPVLSLPLRVKPTIGRWICRAESLVKDDEQVGLDCEGDTEQRVMVMLLEMEFDVVFFFLWMENDLHKLLKLL